MTLRRKILTRIYILTFLIIIAMSGSYYLLFSSDVRKRSHQQVETAFRLIADDLRSRVNTALPQIRQFSDSALLSPMYMLQMFQQQNASASGDSRIQKLTRQMTYLSGIALDMQEFGALVDAREILLYDHDRRLLAVSIGQTDVLRTSVYLPEIDGGVLAPIREGDLWYAMLQHLDEIPREPLPEHINIQDDSFWPEAPEIGVSLLQGHVTLSIHSPIIEQDTLLGLCIVHLDIRRQDVARYARLSGTEVNVFAGSSLSVGTLKEHKYIAPSEHSEPPRLDWLSDRHKAPAVEFTRSRVQGLSYYQGTLWIGASGGPAAAIAVNLPRSQEAQEVRRFLLIVVAITLGFSVLVAAEAFSLSRAIVRPLNKLVDIMQVVAAGNFSVNVPDNEHDEIGRLASSFNAMTAQVNASFAKIESQNRELRKLDKLKDEFLSNTSHELRTPLNGIAGLADAMLSGADGPLTQEERKHTQMILQSCRRLSAMVDSILDYSKARSEKLKPKVQQFDLDQVTDLVLTLAQPQVKDRPVTLSMHIPEDLPKVFGDIDQVGQILTNLVGNAVKFTREGEVVVSAETLTHQPPLLKREGEEENLPSPSGRGAGGEGLFVKITVRDTGIGIPEQALDRIFEAFEQVDGSASREFGGTGLGLAITKELATLHGSDIGVESEEGVGSRFFFTLPCFPEAIPSYQNTSRPIPLFSQAPATGFVQSDAAATSFGESGLPRPESDTSASETDRALSRSEDSAPWETPENPSERRGKSFISSANKGKRIMIIDDDTVNLEIMETHLRHAGFETVRAKDGGEAFRIINGDTVDLILCDVMMPLVDGYTFAMRMQEKEQLRRTPLVFLSAKSRKEDILRGLEAGAVDYITKPVESDELLLKINALLELKRKYSAGTVGDVLNMVVTQDREFPTAADHDPEFLKIRKGQGQKILVVDDEEVNIEVFQSYLKLFNYEVITAQDGYEALQKLHTHEPDLVLLDLMMPGLPGHKVCQEMRQNRNYYELPIIILTAKHDAREKIYGLNVGANDYMLKPFDKEELLTRIGLLLRLSDLYQTVIVRNAELEAEIIERRQAEEALRREVEGHVNTQAALQRLNNELEMRVKVRTEELEATIEHLEATQLHLVEAEKMASLAGLVTGVAHELNTPIGNGITAISFLQEQQEIFDRRYQDSGMTRSELEDFLHTVSRCVKLVFTALQRLSNLVQMFKQLDVHHSGEDIRRFPVKAYLEDTLRSLHDKLDGVPHHIHLSGAEDLVLESFPGALSQIVSSLLMNSLSHAYKEGDVGHIRIELIPKQEELWIDFRDDGRGISPEHLEKIFDPFFTTARGQGGSGLGLHIVYMIVCQKLKGSISCESEPGRGTRFLLRMPLSLTEDGTKIS